MDHVYTLPHGEREFVSLSKHDWYAPGYWIEGNIHGVAVWHLDADPRHEAHNPPRAVFYAATSGYRQWYSTDLPADEITPTAAERIVSAGRLAEDRKYSSGR